MKEKIHAQHSGAQAAKITKRNLKKVKSKKDGKVKMLIKGGYVTFGSKKKRTKYLNNYIADKLKYDNTFNLETFYYKEVD